MADEIRESVIAGSWYPGKAAQLRTDIEDYLSSYVTDDAKISLGPNDMLYLFELTSETPGESDFGLQDLAVVVTFSEP